MPKLPTSPFVLRQRVHQPLWDTLVRVTQRRIDFFLGIGPKAIWIGSCDGPGPDAGEWCVGGGGIQDDWPTTKERFLRDVCGLLDARTRGNEMRNAAGLLSAPDRHTVAWGFLGDPEVAFKSQIDPWPWEHPDHRLSDFAFAWAPYDQEALAIAKDAAIESLEGRPGRLDDATAILIAAGVEREPELVDALDSPFWRYVRNDTGAPQGRVLISRKGYEWHTPEYERRWPFDDVGLGLRLLNDDEVVDMSKFK